MNPAIAAVLDASAILALVQREPGADIVAARLQESAICSVNWSEVLQHASARGVAIDGLRDEFTELGLAILPFTVEDAEQAAGLWSATRRFGLSLGDRACLALALRLRVPVLTADRVWAALPIDASIEVVR